jgi:predicted nuclease of predicted toxin-antitoxin system
VADLGDLFPDAKHVRDFGLKAQPDWMVWSTASRGGFDLLITTDEISST